MLKCYSFNNKLINKVLQNYVTIKTLFFYTDLILKQYNKKKEIEKV